MEPLVDPRIEHYAVEHSSPEPRYLAELAEETSASTNFPQMMVGPLEGEFLKFLVKVTKPRLVLEIGTFTGYSSLCMAAGLGPQAKIITCEIDERHAEIANRHISLSPYSSSIEVRVGPAAKTIAALDGPFDFVFIDADKASYVEYYEAVLPKLSAEGMIAVDNVCWSGKVVSDDNDPDTVAIREFNDHIRDDDRVEKVMLTVRDGLTLIRHRQLS